MPRAALTAALAAGTMAGGAETYANAMGDGVNDSVEADHSGT